MPTNKKKFYSSVLKGSLPDRGYLLAQHLLEILAIYPFFTKTSILKELIDRHQSARNNKIVELLKELKKLHIIENYKIITSSIGHRCINQNDTNDFFVNTDMIPKFHAFIDNESDPKNQNKIKEKLLPFECVKCKTRINYKKKSRFKISIYEQWILLPLGILFILTLPEITISVFDKVYKKDKILKILLILEKSRKKTLVNFFIEELSHESKNLKDLEKNSHFIMNKLKSKILDLKIKKSRQKALYRLQSKMYNDAIEEKLISFKWRNK